MKNKVILLGDVDLDLIADADEVIILRHEAGGLQPENLGRNMQIPEFTGIAEAKEWARRFTVALGEEAGKLSIQTQGAADPVFAHMLAYEMVQQYPGRVELNPSVQSNPSMDKNGRFNRYHHLHELVSSGNFTAARKLAAGHFQNRKIGHLLGLANGLLQFDFTVSELKTENFWAYLTETLAEIDPAQAADEISYISMFRKVARKEQKAFISFLHNYAELLYKENNLIDFVVLYYRLAEETLLYTLGWDIDWSIPEEQMQFMIRKDAEYFLAIPVNEKLSKHYHRYLKVLEKEIYRLNGRPGVIIKPGGAIGLEKLTGRDAYFAKMYLMFKNPAFEQFLALRHEGVSGHGFADFNKNDFEAMLGCSPLEKIEPLLEELGLKPMHSIFELAAKAALALAAEEEQQAAQLMHN